MKKREKPSIKLPLLVKLISILLFLLALALLILVFAYLYIHFFNVSLKTPLSQLLLNIIPLFFASILLTLTGVFLWKRNKLARYLAILELLIVAIWNLKAETGVFEPSSIFRILIWLLYLLAGIYLLFSKKVRSVFR